MSADLELARVRALGQARAQLRHNKMSLTERRKHAEEAIAFYKTKLTKLAEARQEVEALDLVTKLIELRARLVVVELEELQEEEVIVSTKKAEEILKRYDRDCFLLALATDKLLGIEHIL